MKNKQIYFTGVHKAELLETEIPSVIPPGDVLAETVYTVISGGTERACIMGMDNTPKKFPMTLGYCGVGYVVKTGDDVKDVKKGDRVLIYHGVHAKYNLVPRSDVTVVENDDIDSLDAAFVIIASMALGGVRKLDAEIGESAMVMGQGLLGLFATQFLRLSGANPVVAADLGEHRRALALQLGADYAFDPSEEDFVSRVKQVTHGNGINACVEVTGYANALVQALSCAAWQGRISLLGCTRVSNCDIDYYNLVHRPGIKLIGAHNFVRPKVESYPHHWKHHDDCRAILDLIAAHRIKVAPLVSHVVSPARATDIYNQLCDDADFQPGTVFDWRLV